jgi:hypothetical protein
MALVGVKPLVLVSAAMFKLMCDNQKKMESRNEEFVAKKSAEEMSGMGNSDLPPSPQRILNYNTEAPPSSAPVASMLPIISSSAAESTSSTPARTTTDDAPQLDRKKMIPMHPGHPWYYIASHPSDSESD